MNFDASAKSIDSCECVVVTQCLSVDSQEAMLAWLRHRLELDADNALTPR